MCGDEVEGMPSRAGAVVDCVQFRRERCSKEGLERRFVFGDGVQGIMASEREEVEVEGEV